MLIQIKNRYNSKLIVDGDYESLKEAIVKNKDNLSLSNLHYSDLSDSDLHNSDLSLSDLSDSDLSNSDLSNSDLRYIIFSNTKFYKEILNKTPIQIIGLKWSILITKLYMKIGCEFHTIEEWREKGNEIAKIFG